MINSKNSINQFLDEVNNKVRLSDFVGQFVNLTEKGSSFVGKCPFHNENTPSFNVNNEKSFYYCFGCKAGGNILNFVTKYKNLPFKEAVDLISKYSGIPFLINEKKKSQNSEEKLILSINDKSNIFFQKTLRTNRIAYEYLKSRGLNESVIKFFRIGYCPDEKILIDYLKSIGFGSEQIKKTDLLIKNKKGEYFGRFSNRITFPIYNFFNELVGFGGRAIRNSKIKYINSQENLVFKKSEILFGLSQNLEQIRNQKNIFLVEGYMDVIKLFINGIRTAVSTLGTTLSEQQMKKMWNYSDIPYVCFDGDSAGISASKKIALKMLKSLKPGKSMKFITIPNNNDPDSFLENNKREDFFDLKSSSKDLSLLIWDIIEDSISSNTPEFLAVIDDKINQIVTKIEDPKVFKEYSRFLKARKEQFIWNKNKLQISNSRKINPDKIITNINEKIFILMIISDERYLIEFGEEIFRIKLCDENFEKEKRKILEKYSNLKDKKLFQSEIYSDLDPNLHNELNELKKTHITDLNEEERYLFFKQILNNLRLPILIDERKLIKKEMLEAEKSLISESLLKKYNKITEEIKNIQNKALD